MVHFQELDSPTAPLQAAVLPQNIWHGGPAPGFLYAPSTAVAFAFSRGLPPWAEVIKETTA